MPSPSRKSHLMIGLLGLLALLPQANSTEIIDEEPANESIESIQQTQDISAKQSEELIKLEGYISGAADPVIAPKDASKRTGSDSSPIEVAHPDQPQPPLSLLGEQVLAGQFSTLQWTPQNLFDGIPTPTPVLVANGVHQGPTLCLTGAIHGDEINSIETIRRIVYSLEPEKLSGAVVAVPIVNQMGFRRNSRYLPDRRDLNRYFPGTPNGSSASRIAHSLFNNVIRHCDALVDLHTGSFNRTNIPQLRADLSQDSIKALTQQFGDIVVLHSTGSMGTLRREAAVIGIPSVTLEAGEALRIQDDVIAKGVQHLNTLLTNMKMVKRPFFWSNPQPIYMASRWLRAESGGIFLSDRKPGDTINEGDPLGTITDPITNAVYRVHAEFTGKIIGMAMNQVVLPGYAIYHVGIDASAIHKQLQQLEEASPAPEETEEAENSATEVAPAADQKTPAP